MIKKISTKILFSVFIALILVTVGCDDDLQIQAVPSHNFDVYSELHAPIFSPKKKFGIVITAFNRPEYLRPTLDSLKKSDLRDAIVVIVDDGSTNPETLALIEQFELNPSTPDAPFTPLFKFSHQKNSGILTGLMHGFKFLMRNVDFLVNIDADVIMKPDWLEKLEFTFNKIGDPNIILTGFNTNRHPTINCTNDWCEKGTLGGINFFMTSQFYEDKFQKWFRNQNRFKYLVWKMWDWTVVEKMKENGFKLYATKPSVIQHIGFEGLNSNPEKGADVADDY